VSALHSHIHDAVKRTSTCRWLVLLAGMCVLAILCSTPMEARADLPSDESVAADFGSEVSPEPQTMHSAETSAPADVVPAESDETSEQPQQLPEQPAERPDEPPAAVDESLAQSLSAVPAVGTPERIEENDGSLAYSGTWHAANGAAASGGAYRYSSAANATVSFRFTGTGFSVIGPVGPSYGRFEIRIDGGLAKTVSQFAPSYAYQRTVWSVSGLANGKHTVVLKIIGSRDPQSTSNIIVLDAFDVYGTSGATTAPVPDTAVFEERDSRTFREGRWTTAATSAASGGSLLYTGTIGSTFNVQFSGSSVTWIGPRYSNYGRAAVYVDGILRATVSQYAPAASHRQVIWSIDGLSDGRHTLTIKVLGEKDVASKGTIVAVDAFAAVELLVPRFEERDARIKASGTWTVGSTSSASGGGYTYARHADAYAVVPFWGTAFRWLGVRGPGYGMAEVHLDGRLVGVVDLYAPTVSFGETVWSVAGLRDGYHAVVIRVMGRKAPQSSGTVVIVDGFEFEGVSASPSRWPSTNLRVDDRDDRLARTGAWTAANSSATSGGTYLYSSRAGAAITLTFIGTSVAWVGPVGPSYGQVRIVLDGVRVATVSQYARTYGHQQEVWRADGLAGTLHTLTIQVLGARDAASTHNVVVVDGFNVRGTATRRFEEADKAAPRAGGWTVANSSATSGGTYLYSSRAGAAITLTFIGTSVAWVGPVGPSYGQVRIVLDGVRVATVSQYAPAYSHQQEVWRTDGLADTRHTLTIQVLGARDAASTHNVVVVDGFDVQGERATVRNIVLAAAKQQLGKKYVWAATGPDQFDCSGLVMHAYRAAGLSAPRTSRQMWSATTLRVRDFLQLMPGDLCFSSSPSNIHHVGLYIGWGLSIHAPGTGKFVEYRTAHTYGCWGRISALS
jgi:cell wall-associated NlpC family hydrolase